MISFEHRYARVELPQCRTDQDQDAIAQHLLKPAKMTTKAAFSSSVMVSEQLSRGGCRK